jgi:hypothetical protein
MHRRSGPRIIPKAILSHCDAGVGTIHRNVKTKQCPIKFAFLLELLLLKTAIIKPVWLLINAKPAPDCRAICPKCRDARKLRNFRFLRSLIGLVQTHTVGTEPFGGEINGWPRKRLT